MADVEKLYGSVKRFGVRYGVKPKTKIGKIEAERQLSTKCPYCHYNKAKRISAGIWHCQKCKSRFTGKAYTIGGPAVIREAVEATEVEIPAEVAAETGESAEGAESNEEAAQRAEV